MPTCLLRNLVSRILQALRGTVSPSLQPLPSLVRPRLQLFLIETLGGWYSIVCNPLSTCLALHHAMNLAYDLMLFDVDA